MNETTDQAAADRVRAYLDGRARFTHLSDQIAEVKNGGSPWAYLTVTDLESLLAEREALTKALRVERLRCQSAERLLAMAPDVGVFEQLTGAPQPSHAAPQRHAGAPGPAEPGNETAEGSEAPQGAAEGDGRDVGRCPTCAAWIYLEAGRIVPHSMLRGAATLPGDDPEACDGAGWLPAARATEPPITPEDEGISTTDVHAQIAADQRAYCPGCGLPETNCACG